MFIFGKIVAVVLLPPGVFVLLFGIALVLILKGARRAGLWLGGTSLAALYLLSTVAVSNLLILPLEDAYPPLTKNPEGAAVAVLGGDVTQRAPDFGGRAALGESSAIRAAYGARLALARDLPLYFSAGAPLEVEGAEDGASAARNFWEGLGIRRNRITLERRSLDTWQNAEFLADMSPPEPLIVVTSAYHMPRSMLAFEKAGLSAIAAPTDYLAERGPLVLFDFLPDVSALEVTTLALHEYLGLLYYAIKR